MIKIIKSLTFLLILSGVYAGRYVDQWEANGPDGRDYFALRVRRGTPSFLASLLEQQAVHDARGADNHKSKDSCRRALLVLL